MNEPFLESARFTKYPRGGYTAAVNSDRPITAYPQEWLHRFGQLPGRLNVYAAGYQVTVPIEQRDLTSVYLPVLYLLHSEMDTGRRLIAGLAGIPGSGKSTFAAVLARLADALLGMGRLMAIGLDGWHWPNRVLDARTTLDEQGRAVPLRQRKGGPESFDVNSLTAGIRELMTGRTVSLPVYDRRVHDPVAGGLAVGPGTSMLLLEGNFVLATAPPWDRVSHRLRPKLFLECDPQIARQRVIARHIQGGVSPDEAECKFDRNDRLNTSVVLTSEAQAEYRIRWEPDPGVYRNKPLTQ